MVRNHTVLLKVASLAMARLRRHMEIVLMVVMFRLQRMLAMEQLHRLFHRAVLLKCHPRVDFSLVMVIMVLRDVALIFFLPF
jgi:hypothetical protein